VERAAGQSVEVYLRVLGDSGTHGYLIAIPDYFVIAMDRNALKTWRGSAGQSVHSF